MCGGGFTIIGCDTISFPIVYNLNIYCSNSRGVGPLKLKQSEHAPMPFRI